MGCVYTAILIFKGSLSKLLLIKKGIAIQKEGINVMNAHHQLKVMSPVSERGYVCINALWKVGCWVGT